MKRLLELEGTLQGPTSVTQTGAGSLLVLLAGHVSRAWKVTLALTGTCFGVSVNSFQETIFQNLFSILKDILSGSGFSSLIFTRAHGRLWNFTSHLYQISLCN